jgi:hypothetical protein
VAVFESMDDEDDVEWGGNMEEDRRCGQEA